MADVQSVNQYLKDATDLADKGTQFYDDASKKLELADASLDDVPAAEKPALQGKIAALKSKIAESSNAQEKQIIQRRAKDALSDAEGAIGNLATWSGAAERFTKLMSDPKTKAALGDQTFADYQRQFGPSQS